MKTTFSIVTATLVAAVLTTGVLAQADAQSQAAAAPAQNVVVYVPTLPTPAALARTASAPGESIERIEQTGNQIAVTYRYTSGQLNTVVYRPISEVEAVATPTTTAPVVTAPAPTVVYYTPAPTYYYDPYCHPWGWWYPPVSFHFGFGFRGGGRGHWR